MTNIKKMDILKNLKDPITDIIGFAIIIGTLYEIYFADWVWLWEGIAGVGVGLALFLFPDQWIKDTLTAVRDYFIKKNDN